MSKYVVVLDPGHGGHDSGARGHGYKESDLALAIALKAEDILKKDYSNVFHVIMTRRTDVYLTLEQRVAISNQAKAQFFLSIHLNSGGAAAHGYESFISVRTTHGNRLKHVHTAVHQFYKGKINSVDRRFARKDFWVLRKTYAPAILTENLFISNKKEAQFVANNIEGIAQAHVNGILKFFGIQKKEKQKEPVVNAPSVEMEVLEMKLNGTTRKDIMQLNNYAVDQGIFSHRIATRKELEEAKKTPGWTNRYNKVALEDMTDDELKNKYLSYLARKEYKNK